jgi:hypothetical protein
MMWLNVGVIHTLSELFTDSVDSWPNPAATPAWAGHAFSTSENGSRLIDCVCAGSIMAAVLA